MWFALAALCVLVWENDRISPTDKRLLYLTYAIIAFAALAEWFGVYLDSREDIPRWLLRAVKCADYILTPLAGGGLVLQMHLHNRWCNVLLGLLIANTLFQLVSLFNGWMITVDSQNHYVHGPLYCAYMGVSMLIIIIMVIEFVIYGQAFRRQNRLSLYAIMLFVIIGVTMQEVLPTGPRVIYMTLTMGAALLFIHYSEFASQEMEDHLSAQQIQIDTDVLTGMLSRRAYSQALKAYESVEQLPADLVAFAIDINCLKQTNDTLGHEAGDELIIGAASCIKNAISEKTNCYRTGGDEFVLLFHGTKADAEAVLSRLNTETEHWHSNSGVKLSMSAGYALASDYPDHTAETLVREADFAMYAAKAAFYKKNGIDRRRTKK